MEKRWHDYKDPFDDEQIDAEVLNLVNKILTNTLESSDVTVETKGSFDFRLMEPEIDKILKYHKDSLFAIKVLSKLKDEFENSKVDNTRGFRDEILDFLNGEIKRIEGL